MYSGETAEQAIFRLYKSNLTPYEISKETRSGWNRVTRMIEGYKSTNQIPQPKKAGRPTKRTPEVQKIVLEETYKNRFSSCIGISNDLKSKNIGNVSPSSVFRYRKILKFNFKAPKIQQFLSEKISMID